MKLLPCTVGVPPLTLANACAEALVPRRLDVCQHSIDSLMIDESCVRLRGVLMTEACVCACVHRLIVAWWRCELEIEHMPCGGIEWTK